MQKVTQPESRTHRCSSASPSSKSASCTVRGAHSIGVADGGPGLPVVGWSTAGGDLRVAHFLGIHAMQILPFVGWFVARRRNVFARFKEPHRLVLISTVGFAYLALVLLLVWQALRGQSLIHPDVQTLAAAIVLLALTGLSAWATAAHAKRGYVLCGIRDENNKHRQNKLDMPGPERNPGSWALRKPIGSVPRGVERTTGG
jgi:hypothetical protein